MINRNGAGFIPELEDVWPYETNDRPVRESHHFVSSFITYARNRDEVRNQALSEIEYNYEENN